MTDAEWVLHVKYEKIYTLSFIKFLDYGIKYYKCQWNVDVDMVTYISSNAHI